MLQVTYLRENKAQVLEGLKKRNFGQPELVDQAIDLDEKRKKFDEDLENKTKARLEKIREQLEKEQSRVLNSSSGASEDTICSLRKEYEEKHTEYAHEILRRITEV